MEKFTKLTFCQCINLLSKLIECGLLEKDPSNENNILVYCTGGKKNPEGWYSENILSAASELANDEEGQKFLLAELKNAKDESERIKTLTMKTQKDYFEKVKEYFVKYIESNKSILDSYCYSDHRAVDALNQFYNAVKNSGMKCSKIYHANGIGNNNEYKIYIDDTDKDGFVIKKYIAKMYYCYGVYGGCYVALTDLSTEKCWTVGKAR